MPEQTTPLSDLKSIALETYREEYRDLSEAWRNLDTKGQGLGAIAGIFLAAVFAWAQKLPTSFGWCERLEIVASIVLLVGTIIAAVLALLVRRVTAPPLGDETAEMVRDIVAKLTPEELAQRVDALYGDQIVAWKDTNSDMRQHNESKAFRLACGQVTLLLAAVLVAGLAIMATLSPP